MNGRRVKLGLRERYGQWAVVTGASDGIGLECARVLAEEGMDLVLVARGAARLAAIAAELTATYNVECRVHAADLGDPQAVNGLFEATRELQVGVLIAAAGFGSGGALVDASIETQLALVQVNCSAVLASSWHFARRFRERRRGALVLFSSVMAFQAAPFHANYAASKAYVQSLGEALRVELATSGVDVLVAAPGPVATGFAARAGLSMPKAQDPSRIARATLAALGRRATVRPGWQCKLLGYSLATLPRGLRTRIMTAVSRSMLPAGAAATNTPS